VAFEYLILVGQVDDGLAQRLIFRSRWSYGSRFPSGVKDDVVWTVSENAKQLKFQTFSFEREENVPPSRH
jgi:hypothetical protein